MTSYITELEPYVNNVIHYDIPMGVRIICNYAFSGYTDTAFNKLETIGIPSTVNFIGERAFSRIATLKNVVIPDSVVYLGYACFDCEEYGINRYKSRKEPLRVSIPHSIIKLDGNPFCNKTLIENHCENLCVIDNVLYSADIKILYSYCQQNDYFEVPNGVKVIAKGAFCNSPITHVILPESLEIIEDYAFSDTKVKEVVFPHSLKEIRSHAFGYGFIGNNGMIELPCIDTIAQDSFSFGRNVRFVKVPKGCAERYQKVFPERIRNQVYEDKYVYESGMYFNKEKTELIAVVPNDSNKYIVPEGISIIQDNTFANIYSIDSIELPSSLKSFSSEMFDEEGEINEIIVHENNSELIKNVLADYIDVIKEVHT